MNVLNTWYARGVDAVGSDPSWKRDWRWICLWSVVAYVAVAALRMSFAGRWDHPELWVAGERIMATHDAYFWLAKAKGVGQLAGYPFAELVAALHGWFGFSLGDIGFWMPAVMAPLVGVVCGLWGWLIGGRHGGIFAGLIGALTPGFFYRSRLGYFDSDMFTLLMPLFVAWLLAFWLRFHLRSAWFGRDRAPEEAAPSLWVAFCFGVAMRIAVQWHEDILNVSILYMLFAAGVLLVGGARERRAHGLVGLCVMLLLAFPGEYYEALSIFPLSYLRLDGVLPYYWLTVGWGVLGALALCAVGAGRMPRPRVMDNFWFGLGLFVVLVFAVHLVQVPLAGAFEKLALYFHPAGQAVSSTAEPMGPIYPSIVQSIIEAKLVPVADILSRGAFFGWLGWLALACGLAVMVLRPSAVLLLPLAALHMASIKLGIRFSMFGGAVLMIFLGVALHLLTQALLQKSARKAAVTIGAQLALGLILLGYCHTAYGQLPLTPVFSRTYAEGLVELGNRAPADSMVWSWWDWGYATQYYSGLKTVADGGRHAGRDVYPIGFALSSDSPARVVGMMRFAAQYPVPGNLEFGLAPDKVWDTIPRNELSRALDEELMRTDYPAAPPQYIVVSWKNLTIAKWISYFGNWNLESGVTEQASVSNHDPGELGINIRQGAVMSRRGGGGLVKDITVLDQDGAHSQTYYMNSASPQLLPTQQHLIINKVTGQSVLMDRLAYRSMMTRLLVADPADPEIAPYFKLVVDKLPFVRIYEVVQNLNE